MNSVLELLKKSKPELYRTFTQALIEDLGVVPGQSLGIFSCPECNCSFQIVLSSQQILPQQGKKSRSAKAKIPKRSPLKSPLFAGLVELARLRRTRTGEINTEFKKAMKGKIRNMDKQQFREAKIEWLRKQIAKTKAKAA